MIKQTALSVIVLLFVASGCTKTRVWTSTPQVSELGSSYCKVLFEPLTKEHTFYVLFRLEVANKTKKDLRIDWNKTRYLLNGRSHGGFVFEGIDPQNISKLTIPDDIVPAGEKFSKEIAPYTMLARAPLRIKERSEGEEAIKPGPLPAGENGILLVIHQDGQEISDKVTVKIEVSERRDWF